MSKKSDDSIERIFRQALTQYDTTFKENDWLKMEQLLNEDMKRRAAIRSKRIKGTAFTLTGLTGLFIAVYFLAFNDPSRSTTTLNDSVVEMQASDDLSENGNVQTEIPSDGLLSPSSQDSVEKSKEQGQGSSKPTEAIDKTRETQNSVTQKEELKGKKNSIEPLATESANESVTAKDKNAFTPSTSSDQSNGKAGTNLNRRQRNHTATKATDKKDIIPQRHQDADNNETIVTKGGSDQNDAPLSDNNKSISKADSANLSNAISNPNVSESGNNKSLAVDNIHDTSKEKGASANPDPASIVQKDSLSKKEQIVLNDTQDSLGTEAVVSDKKQKIKPSSRWSVGVVFAPEFSTTSLSRYSKPGESIGLRIGYQISNRLNISTGAIRSMKKYIGTGDEYQPRNPAYWQIRTNGVVPEEIDSKCLVYEFPLTVQFDIIQREKSRLFASTAVSSYIMKSQAYDYTFSDPNPGADMGWRSQGSESYWFSVGMISAGYERYIHRSLAIGIEPYLKVSLSEIGWPNVKLFSTGAYVTLRYKFMSNRNNGID